MNNGRSNTLNTAAAGILGLMIGAMGTAAIALANKDFRKSASKKANEVMNGMRVWSDKIIEKVGKKREGNVETIKGELQEEL